MSFAVLLLATLATCLRFGSGQGDPLPPSLVDLVTGSPIASIEDLQRLLSTDSVEKDSDGLSDQDLHSNSTFPHRVPRSLGDIEEAQLAQCKVRTEVMEVMRSMLDRRNANFLLWPPCVEVQRCSGCCNARSLQCVATVTSIRPLQVLKIQFVNKQPLYEKAVISVEDHVECRCQSAKAVSVPKTTPKKPQIPSRPPPPKSPLLKPQSKEEIHQYDDLKQNQKFQLGDLEGHQWQAKHTHVQMPSIPTEHGELPIKQTSSGDQELKHVMTQQGVEKELQQGQVSNTSLTDARQTRLHLNNTRQPMAQPGHKQPVEEQRPPHHHHGRVTEQKPLLEVPASGHDTMDVHGIPTQTPHLHPHQNAKGEHLHKHHHSSVHTEPTNKKPSSEEQHRSCNCGVTKGQPKEATVEQQREKLQEMLHPQQPSHHHHQHHVHQVHQQSHTTVSKAMTMEPTMRPPAITSPPPPTLPPTTLRPSRRRSSSVRKRTRKNRNRISKTAIRAILM